MDAENHEEMVLSRDSLLQVFISSLSLRQTYLISISL